MNKLLARRVFTVLALVLIVGGVMLKNYLTSLKEPPRQKQEIPAQKVKVIEVQNEELETDILLTGRLQSSNKFDVYSEVTGRLLPGSRTFKEGTVFRKGEVLFQLDNTDARLNLVALRSSFQSNLTQLLPDLKIDYPAELPNWQEYLKSFNPENRIQTLPQVNNAQLKNLLVTRNIYNQYYSIQSAEAQLAKYTIIAPFTGVVSSANINPNTLIRSGQMLGTFLDPNRFEMEAGVPILLIDRIRIGTKIDLKIKGDAEPRTGVIRRISQNVDPGTQTAKVYVDLSGSDLYEGMYLSGTLPMTIRIAGVKIPGNLLQSDQSVYIIEDGLIRKRKVHVVHVDGEQLIISGLEDGTLIINQTLSGAVEGNAVEVVK